MRTPPEGTALSGSAPFDAATHLEKAAVKLNDSFSLLQHDYLFS
jgi:hypothetical protein